MMNASVPTSALNVRSAVLVAITLLSFVPMQMAAQAPKVISFQGYLTDTGGTPSNTTASMTFKLYKGTTNIWTETQASVQVVNGIFNVLLGNVTPLDTVAFDQPMDLGIKVGTDPEISPRTPLAAAAFALGMPGLHAEYAENLSYESYNVVGGGSYNNVSPGVIGATISGGGSRLIATMDALPNIVTDDWGTVGGGYDNTAGNFGTVSGGSGNVATGEYASVSGGTADTASGTYATVAGGVLNIADGAAATVPGGILNRARGDYSFAAGRRAKADHDGTFVWADKASGLGADFQSTGVNQFLIRASGGVGIGTNSPGSHSLAINDSDAGGIPGASLHVDNNSTGNGIAAHLETSGTDASLVIDQYGTGDHIRTFANGDLRFRVYNNGNVTADGTFTGGGADLAEAVEIEGRMSEFEAGDVLVVSTSENRSFAKSWQPYSDLVAGVYATKPGVLMTNRGVEEDLTDRIPMGVVGIIPTKVTMENGPIRRGDLLVTSSTPGHAMRADRSRLEFGMVLGKALEPFDAPSTGMIEVLVLPR